MMELVSAFEIDHANGAVNVSQGDVKRHSRASHRVRPFCQFWATMS